VLVTPGLAVICLAGLATQPPELDAVLTRAGDYVESYERTLGMVIAREVYIQRVPVAASATMPAAPGVAGNFRTGYKIEEHERRLVSDYMMVRLPSEGDQWVGFRAVIEVDGHPVRDRLDRLQELLAGSPEAAVERWRKLSQESARYNIGNVNRNTNVPTFALLIVRRDYRDRFEFQWSGTERVEDLDVRVIAFQERATPALITDQHGRDVFTQGRIWVDPTDGRVVRTEVRTGGDRSELRSEITVRYRPHAKLGIWVPHDMNERYKIGSGRIDAIATYSDYQQFNVSVDTSISK